VGKYTLPVNGIFFFVFPSAAADDGLVQSTSRLPPQRGFMHLSTSIKIPPNKNDHQKVSSDEVLKRKTAS
jgi:hypothetical protein